MAPPPDLESGEEPEASVQGMVRQIIAAMQSITACIFEIIVNFWNSALEIFVGLYTNIVEYFKNLDGQDRTNFGFSMALVILSGVILYLIMSQDSYRLTTEQLILNMTTSQQSYRYETEFQMAHMANTISVLKTALINLQLNDTSFQTVDSKIADLQNNMNSNIQHNVQQLNSNIAFVSDNFTRSLSDVHEQFQTSLNAYQEEFYSQTGVFTNLIKEAHDNSTQLLKSVHASISGAVDTFTSIQSNVTTQISQIHDLVNSSVASMDEIVREAKETIDKVVKGVRSEVFAYKNETNNEFSAESDFVKFQLAGS